LRAKSSGSQPARRAGHLQVVLDLFCLSWRTARASQILADFSVRLSVEPAAGTLFRRPDPMLPDHFQRFTEDDRIPPFQPVHGVFSFNSGASVAMDTLVEVTRDAVSQIGVDTRLDARYLETEYRQDD
jgi:hypothetical protein